MDWDDFQDRARAVVPEQQLKAKRCWIGVLRHEKSPTDALEENDFIWMIGHGKVAIQIIYDTYLKHCSGLEKLQIKHKNVVVDRKEVIKSFLRTDDKLVVFIADATNLEIEEPGSTSTPQNATPPAPAQETATNKSKTPSLVSRLKSDPTSDVDAARSTNVPDSNFSGAINSATDIMPLLPDHMTQHSTQSINGKSNSLRPGIFLGSNTSLQASTPSNGTQIAGPPPHSAPYAPPLAYDQSHLPNSVVQPHPLDSEPSAPISERAMNSSLQLRYDPTVTFNPGDVFGREASPDQENEALKKPSDENIRKVISQADVQILEAGVAQSIKVLDTLKTSFVLHGSSSPDAAAWVDAIEKLTPQSQRKPTIVGVVGNTGAGKSSVINAMLDEERLVPTNCMRACTAVVTEMSWNTSTDARSKYRAEIEFISHADWEKEVKALLTEFIGESGTISREISNPDSEAGVAWAKFHAVYPKITQNYLNECNVEILMSDRTVLSVLGTTKKINTQSPATFYQQLQKYVDSKEKVTKKDKDKPNKSEVEYWPLIKVVKIYTKAEALSTGAVVVDLPGVHDSNAARAAVAQKYLKNCTGLWIVAPITRAVDDKAAKTLLGDSFKRQLKYDGGISAVTFICSKTDDISITEAIDTLGLEHAEELYQKVEQNLEKIRNLQEQIQDIKDTQDIYKMAQKEIDAEIEQWEECEAELEGGKVVYAPRIAAKIKRKAKDGGQKSRKRHKSALEDSDDDFIISDEEVSSASDDETNDEEVQAPQTPITADDIKVKIKELRESKKNARRQFLESKPALDALALLIKDLKVANAVNKAEINHLCIVERNTYSKLAIQQDFAAGIREMDQENAAEEDEENFNPDEDLRDYDAVARSLPVFCVSSRAYQKLQGRLQKDGAVAGFKVAEETEMPQLQMHCKKLTENGRIQTARSFLLNLCQQLTTFSLWASNDGTGLKLNDEEKRREVKYIERRLKELDKGLEDSVRACLSEMKKELNSQIFERYPDLIQEAIRMAPDTVQHWGSHKSDGGLPWATYKAICRREGVFHSRSAGARDFNSDLVNPIIKKLASGWERAFQHRLPRTFEAQVKATGGLLHKFHEAIEERACNNGVSLASLSSLKTQINTYEMLFNQLNQVLVEKMNELQREANRDFTPTIASIMHTVYDTCDAESGKGSFKRMKDHMTAHVERNRHNMFTQATLTVRKHLDKMCKELEDLMSSKGDEIFVKMQADYMRVLGGVQVNTEVVMSREERILRSEIMDILRGVDAQFLLIANGQIPDTTPEDNTVKDEENNGVDRPEQPEYREHSEEAEQRGGPSTTVKDYQVNDDEDSVFEYAREFVNGGNDDSMMYANDTMITEPSPGSDVNMR